MHKCSVKQNSYKYRNTNKNSNFHKLTKSGQVSLITRRSNTNQIFNHKNQKLKAESKKTKK